MADDNFSEHTLAEQAVRLQIEIAERQEKLDAIKNYFKFNYAGAHGIHEFQAVTGAKLEVKVTKNERIDDNLARTELSAQDYKRVSKATVDTKKARALLDESKLSKITKVYDDKIEIKVV